MEKNLSLKKFLKFTSLLIFAHLITNAESWAVRKNFDPQELGIFQTKVYQTMIRAKPIGEEKGENENKKKNPFTIGSGVNYTITNYFRPNVEYNDPRRNGPPPTSPAASDG